jgi:ribulose-5-phosphate 4-epimerase/fuculose-1-phosphate aldolase
MNKLRKIFTIRTPYAFYNNTNVEYGIVITHRVNGEVSEEFTLKSKQRWPINFKFYQDHDYKIYVKRPDDKCYYSAN